MVAMAPKSRAISTRTFFWSGANQTGRGSIRPVMRLLGTLVLTVAVSGLSTVSAAEATPPAPPPTCHGERATIVGTTGDDRLEGTGGVDVIVGLAGDDRLVGMDGDDVLCGGSGADVLQGGPGDDRLFGGADRWHKSRNKLYGDTLDGGDGDDLLDAGFDTEHPGALTGKRDALDWGNSSGRGVSVDLVAGTATGHGQDEIVLSRRLRYFLTFNDDTFRGTDRTDKVWGIAGSDDIATGLGNDSVRAGSALSAPGTRTLVRTGGGDDSVRTSLGSYDLDLGSGDDYVLAVDSGPTRLDAGTGSDEILQGMLCATGAWSTCAAESPGYVLSGGPADDGGIDTLVLDMYSGPTEDATVASWDLSSGTITLGGQHVATTSNFERPGGEVGDGLIRLTVIGTSGADEFSASTPTTFNGGAGDDVFNGGYYADTFDGGQGDDTYADDLGGTNTCTDVEADPRGSCS